MDMDPHRGSSCFGNTGLGTRISVADDDGMTSTFQRLADEGEWEPAHVPWLWWAIVAGIVVLEVVLVVGIIWWFEFR